MHHTNSARSEEVRQLIFSRARQISRQITAAAEEIGEHAAECRRTDAGDQAVSRGLRDHIGDNYTPMH